MFDEPRDAFLLALDEAPLVLAIGEAHAPKGSEQIESSAKRFTRQLLPTLEGHASDLLVELMMPPTGCKAKTEDVRAKQKVVTEKQASTNQGEYTAMGEAARKLGIVPDLLRPSCADLDAVSKGGDDAVARSLEMIARLATAQGKTLVERDARLGEGKMVVLYGGALHNDPEPPPERATWSFAAALSGAAQGRYVAIDLFVPEYIDDSAAWKSLAWYPHFDRAAHPGKTTLFRLRPGSYVLIFPSSSQ